MKPTAFQVFCGYHLGLDKDFKARFFNLNSLATHYGIGPQEMQALLEEYRLDAWRTRKVEFNLVQAHGQAQELAMFGGGEDVRQFARRAFVDYMAALEGFDPKRDRDGVDYDHLFPGDPPPRTDPED